MSTTSKKGLYIGVGQGTIHPQHHEVMGKYPIEWYLIDKYVSRPDVLKMDGLQLGLKSESFSVLYTSHVLEHFQMRQTQEVLKEWYRVLEPGGEIITNVPNLDWFVAAWQLPHLRTEYYRTDEKMLEILYGGQDYPGEFHFTGFSESLLRKHLEAAGFHSVSIDQVIEAHECGCLIATARR